MARISLWIAIALLTGFSQDLRERFLAMSHKAEQAGLAEPFRGVTTDGKVTPGLFSIRSTGVSTEPVRKAALAFLAGLAPEQRKATEFTIDDAEWRKWMNQHFYIRQGVSFLDMSAKQKELAFGLLRAGLSARGLTLSRDIMRLNETLGEINGNDFENYGEGRYHITVMGTPSATAPWGWQIDGHHLIINYFVLGDQVVMTPAFFGSEPVAAKIGKYKGTAILQREPDMGLALLNALTPEQRTRAVLASEKKANNNLTEAWQDNAVVPAVGLAASEMTGAQRKQLLALAAQYIGNMDDGHARVKMAEVEKHLDATRFAWVGGSTQGSVFYYRIHSPVVLIEFDHQRPVGTRKLYPTTDPVPDHVHVVIRTPNGNDYGKDLLRQHYERHPH